MNPDHHLSIGDFEMQPEDDILWPLDVNIGEGGIESEKERGQSFDCVFGKTTPTFCEESNAGHQSSAAHDPSDEDTGYDADVDGTNTYSFSDVVWSSKVNSKGQVVTVYNHRQGTNINRVLVKPEALENGKERFKVPEDSVIVPRLLNKEETEAHTASTAQLRGGLLYSNLYVTPRS